MQSKNPRIHSSKLEKNEIHKRLHTFALAKKKCVFTVRRPSLIFGPALNFFMALLVENYLNTLFLPSNVVFDV